MVPNRPKTPLVDTRNRPKTPSMGVAMQQPQQQQQQSLDTDLREMSRTPVNALVDQFQNGLTFHDSGNSAPPGGGGGSYNRNMNRSRSPGRDLDSAHYDDGHAADSIFNPQSNGYPSAYESDYGRMTARNRTDPYAAYNAATAMPPYHNAGGMDPTRPMDYGYGYSAMSGPSAIAEYQDDNLGQFHRQDSGYGTQPQSVVAMPYRNGPLSGAYSGGGGGGGGGGLPGPAMHKEGTSFEHEQPYPANPGMRPVAAAASARPSAGVAGSGGNPMMMMMAHGEWVELNVALLRHETGFGFRIVGGTEEGSQVRNADEFLFFFCTRCKKGF